MLSVLHQKGVSTPLSPGHGSDRGKTWAKNIHVQHHQTNMIDLNEEMNETQNDAPFVGFYDMRAVTFVLPDETEDVSIAGL